MKHFLFENNVARDTLTRNTEPGTGTVQYQVVPNSINLSPSGILTTESVLGRLFRPWVSSRWFYHSLPFARDLQ